MKVINWLENYAPSCPVPVPVEVLMVNLTVAAELCTAPALNALALTTTELLTQNGPPHRIELVVGSLESKVQ